MKSKIYTKTGDSGKTSLFGGNRVLKNSLRIESYGTVDELNSVLGVVLSQKPSRKIKEILNQIQNDLFILGADLATPLKNKKLNVPRVNQSHVTKLENIIDELDIKLKPLKYFILPSGNSVSSFLHLARAIARRAERLVVALSLKENIGKYPIIYLNRVNDLFFILARFEMKNKKEKIWNSKV